VNSEEILRCFAGFEERFREVLAMIMPCCLHCDISRRVAAGEAHERLSVLPFYPTIVTDLAVNLRGIPCCEILN
jgi:hypothetical protein